MSRCFVQDMQSAASKAASQVLQPSPTLNCAQAHPPRPRVVAIDCEMVFARIDLQASFCCIRVHSGLVACRSELGRTVQEVRLPALL